MHPNQITPWKPQLLDGAAGVFGTDAKVELAPPPADVSQRLVAPSLAAV